MRQGAKCNWRDTRDRTRATCKSQRAQLLGSMLSVAVLRIRLLLPLLATAFFPSMLTIHFASTMTVQKFCIVAFAVVDTDEQTHT